MIAISLDKNIECETICNIIQQKINSELVGQNVSEYIMVIKFVKPIINNQHSILKLESK